MEAVGAVVFKAAVGFLFRQATYLLKRWGERGQDPSAPAVEAASLGLAGDILQGQLGPIEIHWDDARHAVDKVQQLWSLLAPYAQGLKQLTEQDESQVARSAGQLRDLLEAIYGQRITFKGEEREPSGTALVRGVIDADLVKGTAGGIITEGLFDRDVEYEGTAKVGTVDEGGIAGGVIVRRPE